MKMNLRGKILLITVLPLVTLSFATLWVVNRSVTKRTIVGINDDLQRSSAVFENILAARTRTLLVSGAAIAQDPKFFSVLTLPGTWRDPQIRATVRGVARDFNQITQSDLFEVLDARGNPVASVGRESSTERGRAPLLIRKWFLKYQDRILFGSDGNPSRGIEEFWIPHWRFLETYDEHFDHPAQIRSATGAPLHGRWWISGIGLPDAVLRTG